ncbi:MAG: prepilin peptidase [Pacificimonas sp.]|jgi:prepilin peptidase CpaA|nr:prepilin peptidase [Pacificimonas sp.]
METFLFWAALAGLGLLLVCTAYSDLTERRIPNAVTLAIAVLAVPYWLGRGMTMAELGAQALFAAVAVGVLLLIWQAGFWLKKRLMGGGDVKLLAALALWLPASPYIEMLFWMALAGLGVTLLAVAENRWRGRAAPTRVPYGVAIVIGVLAVHGELIVNEFPA